MRNKPLLQMGLIGAIGIIIGIPVALSIPWFPADASTQAHNIHTLYDVLLIVSVPVFVLVETVVLYSVWKFRMKPGEEEKDGPPIHGNTRLEVVWTAIPAILLVSLCGYAYSVLRSNEKTHPGARVINVTERQFAFQFGYAAAGGKEILSPELYLPKGAPGRLPPALAGRHPQLLRAGVLRQARRRARYHDHGARHADASGQLSGRVHGAVWRRAFAHARPRARRHPNRVQDVAGPPEARRATAHRSLPAGRAELRSARLCQRDHRIIERRIRLSRTESTLRKES